MWILWMDLVPSSFLAVRLHIIFRQILERSCHSRRSSDHEDALHLHLLHNQADLTSAAGKLTLVPYLEKRLWNTLKLDWKWLSKKLLSLADLHSRQAALFPFLRFLLTLLFSGICKLSDNHFALYISSLTE